MLSAVDTAPPPKGCMSDDGRAKRSNEYVRACIRFVRKSEKPHRDQSCSWLHHQRLISKAHLSESSQRHNIPQMLKRQRTNEAVQIVTNAAPTFPYCNACIVCNSCLLGVFLTMWWLEAFTSLGESSITRRFTAMGD